MEEQHYMPPASEEELFPQFLRRIAAEKGMKWKDIYSRAGFKPSYGSKLVSMEKRTKNRDYILRLCFALEMQPEEVQTSLQLYGMARLYGRFVRDGILLSCLANKIYALEEINHILQNADENTL